MNHVLSKTSGPGHPGGVADIVLPQPPHNFEAEQALLGAILMNNKAAEKVAEFLRAEHFADPVHGLIYGTCLTLIDRKELASPVTVKVYIGQDPGLQELGGDAYLMRLARAAASIINAEDYARLVFDLALRRALIAIGEDVVNDAFAADIERSAPEQIEAAEQRLFDLATTGDVGRGFQSLECFVDEAEAEMVEAHERDGALPGVTTGLRDLDDQTGGLQKSDLIILGGMPSSGKTALATEIAVAAAEALEVEVHPVTRDRKIIAGAGVAFVSAEMSGKQLVQRMAGTRAGIPVDRMRQGKLNHEEMAAFRREFAYLKSLPLWVDDGAGASISAVRSRCRRMARQHPIGLVVVDFLQMLQGTPGKRYESREAEVADIARGLKGIAKELKVPVLAISSLNRDGKWRDEKRPQLSDLRESGNIEFYADVVMFIHREHYFLSRAEPSRKAGESDDDFRKRFASWEEQCAASEGIAEAIFCKNRFGPIGTIKLQFDDALTRFSDLNVKGYR